MKKLKICITIMILMAYNTAFAEDNHLINYLDHVDMNDEQRHYFEADQENNTYYEYDFATISVSLFDQNKVTLRLYNHYFDFVKEDRSDNQQLNRNVWIGRIPNTHDFAHFVINGENVVGHIKIDGMTFNIRPLTNGLHIVGEINTSNVKTCETDDVADRHEDFPSKSIDPTSFSSMDEREIMQQQTATTRGTGECNIRVLIVYTAAIDAIYSDILSEAINQMALANTGASNSGLTFQWEIAAVKEITYFEDTFSAFVHRNRLIDPADGIMDEAHTWRNLWSADQVSLLFAGGAGATIISLDPAKALSTTGSGNFNVFTFQHELAHNFTCTHDLINTIEPGTAPFAGYGEPTTGCFRTIMAYPQACGGIGSCGRDNVFSDNTGTWNCNSINYAKGTANNRNTDILNTNDATVVDHRTVGTNVTYGGDYNWANKEAVHFAANDELTYSGIGSNNFEFFSGSQGSFRATTGVTLGEGFWARSGSDFRAYRENCSPVISPQPDEIIAQNKFEEMVNLEETGIHVYPNPTSDLVNIDFFLEIDGYVSLSIYDIDGRLIERAISEEFFQPGMNTIHYKGGKLAAGHYLLTLEIDERSFSKKISIVK